MKAAAGASRPAPIVEQPDQLVQPGGRRLQPPIITLTVAERFSVANRNASHTSANA